MHEQSSVARKIETGSVENADTSGRIEESGARPMPVEKQDSRYEESLGEYIRDRVPQALKLVDQIKEKMKGNMKQEEATTYKDQLQPWAGHLSQAFNHMRSQRLDEKRSFSESKRDLLLGMEEVEGTLRDLTVIEKSPDSHKTSLEKLFPYDTHEILPRVGKTQGKAPQNIFEQSGRESLAKKKADAEKTPEGAKLRDAYQAAEKGFWGKLGKKIFGKWW